MNKLLSKLKPLILADGSITKIQALLIEIDIALKPTEAIVDGCSVQPHNLSARWYLKGIPFVTALFGMLLHGFSRGSR